MSKDGIPLEALNKDNSRLLTFDSNNTNHLRKLEKKENVSTTSFEPATAAGDDFDL